MSHCRVCSVLLLVVGVTSSALAGGTGNGPDVIVSTIGSTLTLYGTLDADPGPATNFVSGYAMTTVSCNLGEADAIWVDAAGEPPAGYDRHDHPVIGQNLYRLKDGRFEQIGMAWLKHGFCAADAPSCGSPYEGNGSCHWLGTHATDTYSASLNAAQGSMGPKSEINPWTGDFPYPFVLGWSQTGNSIFKRMQVRADDLNPALNSGAQYFGESQYICTDEQQVNRYNNVSHRRVNVGAASGNGWNLSFTLSTVQQQAAILAWAAADPTVVIANVDVPNDGRFVVGTKVTDLGNGTWHYEYAVFNMNSARAARLLQVSKSAGATVSNLGFKDVPYHSGEPFAGDDWSPLIETEWLVWAGEDEALNPNANALRWGTLYNYWFDANAAPVSGQLTLGLFARGDVDSVSFEASVPGAPPCSAARGDADCNGAVNLFDVDPFIVAMFDNAAYVANPDWCGTNCGVDVNQDGGVNFLDIDPFLECVFATCP